MVAVRSVRIDVWIEAGNELSSCGKSALMRSTTWMMFAPGCRWTLTMTAGTSFVHAACFEFSTPSATVATSESRTGAPFRYAITTERYSSAASSWSFAPIWNDCRGPSKLPFG